MQTEEQIMQAHNKISQRSIDLASRLHFLSNSLEGSMENNVVNMVQASIFISADVVEVECKHLPPINN